MQEVPETVSSASFILPLAVHQRKIKVYNKLIVTVVSCGCEAWSVISKDEGRQAESVAEEGSENIWT
jgi:hypothetical protein